MKKQYHSLGCDTTSETHEKEHLSTEEKLGKQEVGMEALKRKIAALQEKLERVYQEERNAHAIHEHRMQKVNNRGHEQLEILEQNMALIQKVQKNVESLHTSQDTLAELFYNLEEGVSTLKILCGGIKICSNRKSSSCTTKDDRAAPTGRI